MVDGGGEVEIKNAPNILKSDIWRHFGFYELTEQVTCGVYYTVLVLVINTVSTVYCSYVK